MAEAPRRLIKWGKRAARALRASVPGGRSARRQESWERRWASADYRPQYEIGTADPAVQRAVEDGWFVPGMRAVDIGCGKGHNAALLARQGLDAVGIDFAPSVITAARGAFRNTPNLSFEVVDVVQPKAYPETFDVLVDRGCLHGIDETSRPAYVANVVAWARPGARFLLIMRTKGAPRDAVIAEARAILDPHFEYLSAEDGDVAGPDSRVPLPAVAMRFAYSQ